MQKLVETARDLTTQLDASLHTIRTSIAEMRARLTEKRREHDAARTAHVSLEELRARIATHVAQSAARWLERNSHQLLRGNLGLASADRPSYSRDVPDLELTTWGALCVIDPSDAGTRLEALTKAAGYQPGRSAADRETTLARLATEIADIEAAEERAIDDARAVGVLIEHRPEVTDRRIASARLEQLEAERIADRQQRQAKLDAAYGSRRR